MNLYPFYLTATGAQLDINKIVFEIRDNHIDSLNMLKENPELLSSFIASVFLLAKRSALKFSYDAHYIYKSLKANNLDDEKKYVDFYWLDEDFTTAGLEKILEKFESIVNTSISPSSYVSMLLYNVFLDELSKTTPSVTLSVPNIYAKEIKEWVARGACATDIENTFPDVVKNYKRLQELHELEESANVYASAVNMTLEERSRYITEVSKDYMSQYVKVIIPSIFTSLNKKVKSDSDDTTLEFGELIAQRSPSVEDTILFSDMVDSIFDHISTSSERSRTKRQMILGVILLLNSDAGFDDYEYAKTRDIVTFYNDQVKIFCSIYNRGDLYKSLSIKSASDFSSNPHPNINAQKISKLKDLGRTAVSASSVLGR